MLDNRSDQGMWEGDGNVSNLFNGVTRSGELDSLHSVSYNNLRSSLEKLQRRIHETRFSYD